MKRPTQWMSFIIVALCYIAQGANPIITDKYTADPAAMVWDDTVYLYVGHDEMPTQSQPLRTARMVGVLVH